jgi:hypothetical protein
MVTEKTKMIKFYSKVKKVENKTRIKRAWKEENKICTEEENLGYYLLLDGSWESLYIGEEEPELKVGDNVEVIIQKRKVNEPKPSSQ